MELQYTNHSFILMGQSNMAGRGLLSDIEKSKAKGASRKTCSFYIFLCIFFLLRGQFFFILCPLLSSDICAEIEGGREKGCQNHRS